MRKYGVIYLIRNNINNKIYIGQTAVKGGFDRRYCHDLEKNTHNIHLKRSIEKYGIEAFYIDKEFDIAYSQEELDKLESMYISIYNATDSRYGYNIRSGGSNSPLAESTKKKLSESKKGKYKGEKNPMYGVRLCGEKHWNYGNHWDEDYKEKQRKAHKNQKHTEEQLLKMRVGHEKEKVKVYCITTDKIFDSIADAGRKYNLDTSTITKVCKGKRKHVKGYKFEYYKDK
ncbi:NUMOD3 domain-containing DNA-binding protein [Clostridium baratii]|uniref:Group I intron endonuclease n=1 Tax=Clostridium baratii TaxID=1561 RepID=A0A174QVS4_9CLOT|nr:NUMOD3 domain-containing DNA-binding protein [Clostridium baratii]CUP74269.1 group I intron endonuclease [Clostridium baratii]